MLGASLNNTKCSVIWLVGKGSGHTKMLVVLGWLANALERRAIRYHLKIVLARRREGK